MKRIITSYRTTKLKTELTTNLICYKCCDCKLHQGQLFNYVLHQLGFQLKFLPSISYFNLSMILIISPIHCRLLQCWSRPVLCWKDKWKSSKWWTTSIKIEKTNGTFSSMFSFSLYFPSLVMSLSFHFGFVVPTCWSEFHFCSVITQDFLGFP